MKAKRKSQFSKYGRQDKIILSIGYFLIALFVLAIIVPIFYIIVASFMDPVTLQNKGITFDFSKWTITAYQRVMSNGAIWIGFKNAVIYSVVFTVVSVVVTLLAAYPMSRTDFKGKKLFNVIFVITMFFGGGLIPTYLLISNLGLLDSMWAVILPVCTPIIATIALWQFVGMWNSYFDAMIYLNDSAKQPLQLVLRSILIQNQPESGMISDMQSTAQRAQLAELLKYATIIISSLPLLVMYPFFQKYFDSGIMAGSVKG